ncbi:CobBQ-type GATase domain protein [Acididesulfobacillus acetoxydans]|uniref:Cobyrinate a,c-diamide synthase n=1 Tax=Acididesulfobacillus acetoxydans TaxID=1561005 RepID=A0A8S0WZD9_9FIRM|nr:cobyrinate a,c-diamide synthase [Acididesulfobacillus acetoxydans]CAA7601911.1 CobBQ-type GATase domain protein [Acididesulfobacillus acetoxydans]CEJ08245.1 Cobyrinic acid A,C-diamide synthase [Acididesulfobacillus acetoxydans]
MRIPRIVVAGTHSGAGKTTLATGIMAALASRGRPVQGYKVGPDYIDPSYHAAATGRPGRNLDRWLLGSELPRLFIRSAAGSWAVVEGVMGLFDGMSGSKGFGSTADIAKLIKAPVVLVIDAVSLAQSAAALLFGFDRYDPDLRLQGVIFNRVKSAAQESMLREAIREQGIPVLGCIPQEDRVRLPERHLGLVPVGEEGLAPDYLERLAARMEKYVDLSLVEDIMQGAPPAEEDAMPEATAAAGAAGMSEAGVSETDVSEASMSGAGVSAVSAPFPSVFPASASSPGAASPAGASGSGPKRGIRLGLAWDEAFLFYYRDALETLAAKGFELVPFSPLHDTALPPKLDGLFLGGGFPELHLSQLSLNHAFLRSLRTFAQSEKPIYAECGGYMYLGRGIRDFQGKRFPLAGVIPAEAEMTPHLQGMGYREGRLALDTFLGPIGTVVHGHEFHYSRVLPPSGEAPAWQLYKSGSFLRSDGYARGSLFASYLHLNFAGQPEILDHWLNYSQHPVPSGRQESSKAADLSRV